MAPVPVPDAALLSVFPVNAGDVVRIAPVNSAPANGLWDYNQIQYVLDQGASAILDAGNFFAPYELIWSDPVGVSLRGSGFDRTFLNSGTPTSPMTLLDAPDRAILNPSAVPSLIATIAPTASAISALIDDITLSSSATPCHDGYAEFTNLSNVELRSLLEMNGRWPVLSRNAVPLTLDDLVATPLGTPGPLVDVSTLGAPLIEVWSGDNSTGTLYVEGADYAIDNGATPAIRRIGGTTIPNHATVYVNYNDLANRLEVPSIDVTIGANVRFRGHWRRVGGQNFSNVGSAIRFWNGQSYGKEDAVTPPCFHDFAVLDAGLPYSDLQYSTEAPFDDTAAPGTGGNQPQLPTNGRLLIEDGVQFERCSFTIWCDGVEGTQSGGPYNFLSSAFPRSIVDVGRIECTDCGADFFGYDTIFIDTTSKCDYTFRGRSFNCYGFLDYGGGQLYGGEDRLPGWVGEPCTILGDEIEAFVGAEFLYGGLFGLQTGVIHLGVTHTGSVDLSGAVEETSLVVRNARIAFLPSSTDSPTSATRVGVENDRQSDSRITSLIFDSEGISLAAEALSIVNNGGSLPATSGVVASGLDLTAWDRDSAYADVKLDALTEDCVVTVPAGTVVDDQGTNNQIIVE